MKRINIYTPNIASYTKSAMDAIESGWISNHGKYIGLATEKLKETMKCKHAILMANGTCATHCLFIALKHAHPATTKIYVPNNAYVAAWNAALMEYSECQLSVMRMDARTWNICTDEDYIATLDPHAAVLIVHNVGNIVNVPRLKRLRPDMVFVEDNCEGFLGKYGDQGQDQDQLHPQPQYSGTSPATLCASVSFYGNKIITTGEGGAFLTNDDAVYDHISRVFSQGMSAKRYVHEVHAYNYRMTNVQAAFLYDQLLDLDAIIAQKTKVFETYRALLNESDLIRSGRVRLFEKEDGTQSTHWIFALRIVGNPKTVDETVAFFDANGIDVRPFFYPIHAHAHLAGLTGDNHNHVDDHVPVLLNQEIVMLPSSPDMTLDEQRRVIETVHKCVMQLNGIHVQTIQDHLTDMTMQMLSRMIRVIKHDTDNLNFRYFNTRAIETALQTHVITNVYYNANDATNDLIGYAHIDFDARENRHWFGIYICKSHRGKKYGVLLLNDIIHQFCIQTNYQCDVYLSVDRTNPHALHLYEMNKFEIVDTHDTYYVMRRNLKWGN
jgi:perosamine synthetase